MALSLMPDEPPFAPLATERLTLRPLRAADAEELHRLVNDWEVVRMLSRLPFPYPRQLTDEWIASTLQQIAGGTGYHLAITGEEAGEEMIVGCIGLRLDLKPRDGQPGILGGAPLLGPWRRDGSRRPAVALGARQPRPRPAAGPCRRVDNAGLGRRCCGASGFRMTSAPGSSRSWPAAASTRCTRFEATRDDFAPRMPLRDQLSPTAPQRTADPALPERPAAVGRSPAKLPEKPIVLVAACALIDADGRILLTRRPGGQGDGRAVGVPGRQARPGRVARSRADPRTAGKNSASTSRASCLARVRLRQRTDYDGFPPADAAVPLPPLGRAARSGREGQALAWVRPDKLADYPMPPADKPLIPLLRDFPVGDHAQSRPPACSSSATKSSPAGPRT